jgi:hypothetical protein
MIHFKARVQFLCRHSLGVKQTLTIHSFHSFDADAPAWMGNEQAATGPEQYDNTAPASEKLSTHEQ